MSEVFEEKNKYVEDRYNNAISYYWKASRSNKKWYKYTRGWTIILGAVVTLTASIATTSYFDDERGLAGFAIALMTPFLAAILSIIAGFSQSFQWGAVWKDMVMTAQLLEKERDRFLITKPEDRDLVKELELLNDYVLKESQTFFSRLIGSTRDQETTPEAVIQNNLAANKITEVETKET